MSIGKKIRFEVFKRDKFICQYCGRSAPEVILHADHIQPISKDGDDDIINLITACADCNLGKSNRELSDDAIVQKRKRQLDELQERREQIEMMAEWQRSLIELDEETTDEAMKFWIEFTPGYSVSESGIKDLHQWIHKYGFAPVLEAMHVSSETYLKADQGGKLIYESVNKAFDYIPKICANKDRFAKKPYLKDLYYIRGIMRNRFHYLNEWRAIEIMERAYRAGLDIEEIRQVALDSKNWTEWQTGILMIMPNAEEQKEVPQ